MRKHSLESLDSCYTAFIEGSSSNARTLGRAPLYFYRAETMVKLK